MKVDFKFEIGDLVIHRIDVICHRNMPGRMNPLFILGKHFEECPGAGIQKHYTCSILNMGHYERVIINEIELEKYIQEEK